MNSNQVNPNLTDLEKSVILEANTERPYTGEYNNFYKEGNYTCRNCGNLLYSSKAKFDAGCGWPAFDSCYIDSINYYQEYGGRVEITCKNCQGHLGHVFVGEQLTEKNTRHCVNSASITFVKKEF